MNAHGGNDAIGGPATTSIAFRDQGLRSSTQAAPASHRVVMLQSSLLSAQKIESEQFRPAILRGLDDHHGQHEHAGDVAELDPTSEE